jgi:hypothetical protein
MATDVVLSPLERGSCYGGGGGGGGVVLWLEYFMYNVLNFQSSGS